ncbi:efflux RND transporter periplasmic adaptor subunit [Bythopirellula goksoeyrii]|uniref:HlyD family secretion protein n=1 Tax=Bythopirellula goksoeyrii TaxID=1400387 RepID=A0A5B9QIF8_9BACT|nr:efflux RND transporter periplasmic adaptor subunit [Bythopirellula goksoeyrii]QEG36796.1 HlyD family secretion protein [Bythopirellula goksoeyrii]
MNENVLAAYTEEVMSRLEPHELEAHKSAPDSWQQVEEFLAKLHELARAPVEVDEFYRQLLAGCVAILAAQGGAIWEPALKGKWKLRQRTNSSDFLKNADNDHQQLLQQGASADGPRVVLPVGDEFPSDTVLLLGAVHESTNDAEVSHRPQAIIELFLRSGCSPAVQQGWEEFLAAVCQIATDFHLHEQLRTLRTEQASHGEVLSLVRRLQAGSNLNELTYFIANEGCRYLGVDRLSVLLNRSGKWKLQAASGAERFDTRADAVKQLQELAEVTAKWRDPIDYSDSSDVERDGELPSAVGEVLQKYLDSTHARRLVAVPIQLRTAESLDAHKKSHSECRAVLIAEDFGSTSDQLLRSRVVELADLCEPALQQRIRLDRFPVRTTLAWTNRWHNLWETWGISRLALAATAIALALAALVFVKTDFEIEAPATLTPLVEQDVFATANGTVKEILVYHGDQVAKGDVLCVLDDPQLALDSERVRGEIATVRKRLEAIAVSRTDRQAREEPRTDRLPLSAEAKQLELRLASLIEQAAILERREQALTLRSPLTGMVLTLDVQHLLRTRPVERGQVLFTVADTHSGWQLKARVPQDQIGYVLAAEGRTDVPLPVRFKLAGDSDEVYRGHVAEICEIAVFDPEKLAEELPDIQVDIAVNEEKLPAARPGMEAKVRLLCGKESLGYVWLHDVWDNLYSWMAF